MLLINAIVDADTVPEEDTRVALRGQLYQSGLETILEKLRTFNNDLLNRKIQDFLQMEEKDNASTHGAKSIALDEDPQETLEKLLRQLEGTRAYTFLQKILHHLYTMQFDTGKRYDI